MRVMFSGWKVLSPSACCWQGTRRPAASWPPRYRFRSSWCSWRSRSTAAYASTPPWPSGTIRTPHEDLPNASAMCITSTTNSVSAAAATTVTRLTSDLGNHRATPSWDDRSAHARPSTRQRRALRRRTSQRWQTRPGRRPRRRLVRCDRFGLRLLDVGFRAEENRADHRDQHQDRAPDQRIVHARHLGG